MKIAIISDTHYGIRNDNPIFYENSKTFFDNVFFPYLDEHKITHLIHMGDLVDRHKYINFLTANRLRNDFLLPLKLRGIETHIILGNHDTFFKNTNSVNALAEIGVDNYFNVYEKATDIVIDGNNILLVPWICDDNRVETFNTINSSTAQICFGHLQLTGFEMYKGSIVSEGDDSSLFNKFDMVFTGHYHHKSTNGHVFYLGNHMEFTWSDFDDPKGFHVFDTETRIIEFIENPCKLFKKISYSDSIDLETINYNDYTGCYIKIVIENRTNMHKWDVFIEKLELANPYECQIIENHLNLTVLEETEIIDENESTINIFKSYVEKIVDETVDKVQLSNILMQLYQEALTIE